MRRQEEQKHRRWEGVREKEKREREREKERKSAERCKDTKVKMDFPASFFLDIFCNISIVFIDLHRCEP